MNLLILFPDLGADDERSIALYRITVHRLSKANYTLLRTLFAFVVSIPESPHLNESDRRDVGIDLASILHLPAHASEKFLRAFDAIFDRSFDEETHRSNNTSPRLPVNPELVAGIPDIVRFIQSLGESVQDFLGGTGNATWDTRRMLSVLSDINSLLTVLRKSATPSTLQELNVPKGPIRELRAVFKLLEFRLMRYSGSEDLSKPTSWRFRTEEIERILGILLRQRELFKLAQQNDPEFVYPCLSLKPVLIVRYSLLHQAIRRDRREHKWRSRQALSKNSRKN